MIRVMADLETAEAYIQTQSGNRSEDFREALLTDILDKRGYSRAQFDSTMSWYSRNVDEFYPLYAKIEKELVKRSRKAVGANLAMPTGSEMWPYSKMAAIIPQAGTEVIRFSFPSSDLGKGDKVVWKARPRYPAEFTALLGVEYADGHCGYVNKSFSPGRSISIDLQTDSAAEVVRIFGNLTPGNNSSLPLWLDSISLTHLPIDTLNYGSFNRQHVAHRPAPHKKVTEETLEQPDSLHGESPEQKTGGLFRERPKHNAAKGAPSSFRRSVD